MKHLKNLASMTLQLVEFDSFIEREVIGRRVAIKNQISKLPKSEVYDVFSQQKQNWKLKRYTKKLIVEPNG
jgi:hypothetical protein